jgi:hypothetical protein
MKPNPEENILKKLLSRFFLGNGWGCDFYVGKKMIWNYKKKKIFLKNCKIGKAAFWKRGLPEYGFLADLITLSSFCPNFTFLYFLESPQTVLYPREVSWIFNREKIDLQIVDSRILTDWHLLLVTLLTFSTTDISKKYLYPSLSQAVISILLN